MSHTVVHRERPEDSRLTYPMAFEYVWTVLFPSALLGLLLLPRSVGWTVIAVLAVMRALQPCGVKRRPKARS